MIGLLWVGLCLWIFTIIAPCLSGGGSIEEQNEDDEKKPFDYSKWLEENKMTGYMPTSYEPKSETKTITNYWENPVTGDYTRHKIDITIKK